VHVASRRGGERVTIRAEAGPVNDPC
jgi:hypothetical protein